MPLAIRVVDRFQDLADVDWASFADGEFAMYDLASGTMIGSSAGITVDTRAAILASTPSGPTTAFASDSLEMYLYDGASWRLAPLPLLTCMATEDIGGIPYKPTQGYSSPYNLHDKILSSVRFGAWNPEWTLLAGGAVQWNGVYLQLYIGGEWKNIISRTDAELADEVNWSDFGVVGINGNLVVYQHKTDMGAMPADNILFGGDIP